MLDTPLNKCWTSSSASIPHSLIVLSSLFILCHRPTSISKAAVPSHGVIIILLSVFIPAQLASSPNFALCLIVYSLDLVLIALLKRTLNFPPSCTSHHLFNLCMHLATYLLHPIGHSAVQSHASISLSSSTPTLP